MTAADRVFAGAPGPELARIAADADDDLLSELVARLYTHTGDRVALQDAARSLARFAALLGPSRRDPTAAEAELMLASVAVDDGRLGEALRLACAVRARVAPDGEPGQVAWAESVLGVVAGEQGRVDDAVVHWDRAAGLFDADGDPSSAAAAASSAASVLQAADRPPDVLRDRWAAAFEWYVRAGQDDDARQCGINSSWAANRALKAVPPQDWDPRRMLRDALAARALAVRAGAEQEAPHLAIMVAVLLSDLKAPVDEIRSWTATARAEYAALDHDPEEVATWQAALNFAEGNAAMLAGDPIAAEPPLRAALARYEEIGDEVKADHVRRQLLTILYVGARHGDERAAALLRETTPGGSVDAAALAAYVAEMQIRETGSAAEYERAHHRTRALLIEAGEPVKAIVLDVEHGAWHLQRGTAGPAHAALRRAVACLADPPPGTGPAPLQWLALMIGFLRTLLAEHAGDRPGAISALVELETAQLAAGSGTFAARSAVHRAELLLAGGDAERAYATALPAALALDAVRFTLADAARRRQWAGIAADGFAVAFRAAAALGYVRELAELLETVRGAGLPAPRSDPADAFDELLRQTGSELLLGGPDGGGSRAGSAAVPGADAIADAGRTALGLPARLRTPWGSPALDDALRRARTYVDPVRADTVVTWSVPAVSPAGTPSTTTR